MTCNNGSMKRTNSSTRLRHGFSLVEILVVLMIISILATIVTINVLGAADKGKRATTVANMKALETGLVSYSLENGFPTQQQGLLALVDKPVSPPIPQKYPSDGFLSTRKLPVDGWGNPFIYLIPSRDGRSRFEIVSYGSDGQPGGVEEFAADITSADPDTFK
ncbi:MAG: general secretion pathway protein G [Candidatus Omnitrophota bacterium]|jgi:general secretion pathway protein G